MIDGAFPQFHASFDFITSAPPVANDDSRGTTVDTLVNIVLVTNDSAAAAADSAASSPAAVPPAVINLPSLTTTQGGTLVDRLDGSVDYTPAAAFVGSDDFQYTLTDESGRVSGAATVTITVSAAANTPPVANDATVNTDEEVSVQINVDSVANDADGDSLTFATFDAVTAQGGTVTVDGTNTILTYSPAADFNGTDTFTYSVTDNIDSSNTATITIIVNPINDPLVCTDVTLATGLDTPLAVSVANDLLSTCSDPDAGDTISLASTTQPNQPGSTLADDGAGTLTYTPATGFEGQDSFTYTATDGTVFDTRTVFIDVSGKIFGNFTMLDGDGVTFGGTNDIVFTWDNTCYNSVAEADAGPENMVMGSDSSFPFFGFPWFAHDIKVYCPGGPYTVDSCNAGVTPPDCGPLTFTVPADHLGGHILFDWNVTADIDVAIVWNNSTGGTWQNVVPTGQLYQGPAGPTPALDEFYEWISVDADGDGIPGIQFVDGPF
ncbi:MAG: Ig-like domain-containing protein, partial [Thiogranum sp.]